MKKRASRHTGLLYIITGLLLLVLSIPGYLSSATSLQEQAAQTYAPVAVETRELLQTTSVDDVSKAVNITAAPEMILDGVDGTPGFQETSQSINFLDPAASFIRAADEALENPAVPDRIEIPAIDFSAPVIAAEHSFTEVEGSTFGQWQAPAFYATGWHPDSALLGEVGNTVINGHHNIYGDVFANLVDVKEGDLIRVYSRGRLYEYTVTNRMILPETFMDAATRMENARWLAHSEDERLTLVTCWPKESYTHRLILVAVPLN